MTHVITQTQASILCNWTRYLKVVHTTYCIYSLYRLWESAVSHLLALHPLRHGTSPVNYLKIQFSGLNPDEAVHSSGEAAYFEVTEPEGNDGKRERLIYVMKDQSSDPCQCRKKEEPWCDNFTISKRTQPFEYAYQAGAAMFAFKGLSTNLRDILMKIGGIIGCLTPILKFHFDSNNLEQFENDPWLPCLAFRSQKPISTKHLGLLGALRMGLNGRLLERIKHNPNKFLVGLVQSIAATLITLELSKGLVTQSDLIKQDTLKVSVLWAVMHTTFFTAT